MTADNPPRGERRPAAVVLLVVLAGVLAVGALLAVGAVVAAVADLGNAYAFPPPLASNAWVQRIFVAAAHERAFGLGAPELALAAGLVAMIALVTSAVRHGRRIASGRILFVPLVLGAALLLASTIPFRIPPASIREDTIGDALFAAPARGGQTTGLGLGLAGILLVALVVGRLAVDSRAVLIGCGVAAVALVIAIVPAMGAAVQPILDAISGPSYPAQSLIPDARAAGVAMIAATGAGAFAIAAAVALVIRMRRRPAPAAAPPPVAE